MSNSKHAHESLQEERHRDEQQKAHESLQEEQSAETGFRNYLNLNEIKKLQGGAQTLEGSCSSQVVPQRCRRRGGRRPRMSARPREEARAAAGGRRRARAGHGEGGARGAARRCSASERAAALGLGELRAQRRRSVARPTKERSLGLFGFHGLETTTETKTRTKGWD